MSWCALARLGVVVSTFCLWSGCGYVGPVVPPSRMLPLPVGDLTALEKAQTIDVQFTAPERTTDQFFIKRFSDIELMVGPDISPFDFDLWAQHAKRYDIELPDDNSANDPSTIVLKKQIAATDWVGKTVTIAVRTAVRGDRYSQWSNRVVLPIVQPLEPPVLTKDDATDTAQGIRLRWQDERPGLQYRFFRKGPNDKEPVAIGTADKPDFTDTASQYLTPYQYTVVAVSKKAESLPSEPIQHSSIDTFAPSVPANVAGLAAASTVELAWDRSPEPDLKGYFVYRSVDNGPFARFGDIVNVPSLSDHDVQHGKSYHYQISSVDQVGNESAKSSSATIEF